MLKNKFFLILTFSCFAFSPSVYSMDNNSKNQHIKISADEECIVCFEAAKDMDKENIHVTNCCKHFLCAECAKKIEKKCPYCRNEENFKTVLVSEQLEDALEQHEISKIAKLGVRHEGDPWPRYSLDLIRDACRWGSIKEVKQLIQFCADVNVPDKFGNTLLHIAASNDYKNIAELLIARGANVNVIDNNGSTPLHDAVQYDCEKLFKLLITKGANVNAINQQGLTPLSIAYNNKNEEIAHYLLQNGANPELKNKLAEVK